jgi:NADP-dependent aldehyde dehydrogenase
LSDSIASLTGQLFIGSQRIATPETFQAVSPSDGSVLKPLFSIARHQDVEAACKLAAAALDPYRATTIETRACFLETIAKQIEARSAWIIGTAETETGLPKERLTGELGRTCGQLRLFAAELRDGRWQGIRLDPALPERKPTPRSDLRLRKIPLGPVAVFGASNFPLAFSVAGGDTAAALAAGCPVVVKAHPAHPGTSELVAGAIVDAVGLCNLSEGVFSMLASPSKELGAALVADPRIMAVAFTGSRAGGRALMAIAAQRADPIPVYAEMSSINPVLLLPEALAERAETLAEGFVASLTLGTGQFCTNPGLIIAIDGPALERFIAGVRHGLAGKTATTMLSPDICANYCNGVVALQHNSCVQLLAEGAMGVDLNGGRAHVFGVAADNFLKTPLLSEEVFGPASLIVRCPDATALHAVVQGLEGQLTATLQLADGDLPLAQELLPVLERRAGRIIANGWPTGVEVTHAMVHGGPFPATSDGRSTSVGTLAIDRFLRPICYQDFSAALLPEAVR